MKNFYFILMFVLASCTSIYKHPELKEPFQRVTETYERCESYIFADEKDQLKENQDLWLKSRDVVCPSDKVICLKEMYDKRVKELKDTCGIALDYHIQDKKPMDTYSYEPLCAGKRCPGAKGKMMIWKRDQDKIFINAMTRLEDEFECDCHLEGRKINDNEYSLRFDRLENHGQGNMTYIKDRNVIIKTGGGGCCDPKATINGEWKRRK